MNETTGEVLGEVFYASYLFDGLIETAKDGAESLKDAVTTEATGKGVFGDTKTFTASHIGPLHLLYNPQKNITSFVSTMDIPAFVRTLVVSKLNEFGVYLGNKTEIAVLPEFIQFIAALNGLGDWTIESAKSLIVCDIDDYLNVPLTEPGVDAYYNITLAYDYYYNRFDRLSYDNKGAAIRIYTNFDSAMGMQFDNACWYSTLKSFYVTPVKNLGHNLAADAEVIGHEYTHAVFGSYSSGGGEISGINESYADTFGILMSHPNSWKVGHNTFSGIDCYMRDLEEINSTESRWVKFDKLAPETYHDEYWVNWDGEEHAISCMLSNISYKMYTSGHFSQYELEEILFKSLTYGYSGDDNYVTYRQQILQAMKELNYSVEQRNYVRGLFDEKEIFDDTDIYECEPEPTPEEIAYEEFLEKLKELNKDGDSVHRFAIMTSPIGFVLNKVPLYVYEESTNPSSEEEEIINDFLNQYWVNIGGAEASDELGEYVGYREGNAIEYKQVSPTTMDMIEFIFGKTKSEILDITSQAISEGNSTEEEQSIINTIVNLIFVGNVGDSSRSEFFEGALE